MTPENSTHTGVGATACASASQKWNGTMAALDQPSGDDEHERHHDQAVRPVPGEVLADLGHVERAGAAVDDGDPGQGQVGADAVGDGEVQRALDRAAFLGPVGGQRVGRHAHQLEPDEHVEDVAGQAEPGHARQERQHQHVVVGGDPLEVPPGEDHARGDQHRGQAGQARAERPDLEVDADRDPVVRPEAAEPVDLVVVRDPDHDDHQQDGHHGAGRDGDRVQDPALAAQQRGSARRSPPPRAAAGRRPGAAAGPRQGGLSPSAGRALADRGSRTASGPGRRWPAAGR